MPSEVDIRIKRVYEPSEPSDGVRILVDRLWPRGLSKEDAAIAIWAKNCSPSSDLRKWFAHDAEKFAEFTRRYRPELDSAVDATAELLTLAADRPITLLYAAQNTQCNNAVVLRSWLQGRLDLDSQR